MELLDCLGGFLIFPNTLKRQQLDVQDAIDWYTERKADQAYRFCTILLDLEERILQNPYHFPIAIDNLRRARFQNRFPYSIYFFIEKNVVFIVAIFQDKRDPSIWQDRL
jgi:plasmid stabilization system protein ParE